MLKCGLKWAHYKMTAQDIISIKHLNETMSEYYLLPESTQMRCIDLKVASSKTTNRALKGENSWDGKQIEQLDKHSVRVKQDKYK